MTASLGGWLGLLVLIPAEGAAPAAPPPVVNGSPTTEAPAVGALFLCDGAGCEVLCSGSLVEPRWVLTAGHCVAPLQDALSAGDDAYFGVGSSLEGLTESAQVVGASTHPGFRFGSSGVADDVALVELSEEIDLADPYPLQGIRPTADWYERDLLWVGWGITGDGRTDAGTKRAVEMPLIAWDDQFLYAWDSADGENLCNGDSGGAVLHQDEDGSYTLVGVSSFVFGAEADALCDDGGAAATRLDQELSWIEAFLSAQAEPDGGGGSGGGGSGVSDDGGAGDGGETTFQPAQSGGCQQGPAPAGAWSFGFALLTLRRRWGASSRRPNSAYCTRTA